MKKLRPEKKHISAETAPFCCARKTSNRRFDKSDGFPFDGQRAPEINFEHPNLLRPKLEGKTVVLPASWRDDDAE